MSRFREWLQSKTESRPVLKNILTLLTGTAAGQAITMVVAIFTARIYPPEVFGQFAIYASLTGILITVASLRYDLTIMLPSDDDTARVIARLATMSNVFFACLASVLALIFRDAFANVFDDETVANWLVFSGLTIFFVAQVNVLQYWFNRKSDYKTIAINRFQQNVGAAGGQLGFGLLGVRSMPGMLFGTLVGQGFAYFNLRRKSSSLRAAVGESAPTVFEVAKRYKKMPLLNLPNAIIDSIRLNGITILIGIVAVGAVGQFNLAWRVMQVPIGLINGAIAQVFFQALATVKRGKMAALVTSTIKRSFLLSIVPFGVLFIISPWLFTFVFGDQWELAGHFGRAIAPWLAFQLVSSPVSNLFVVTESQQYLLVFSIFYCAVPLSWLVLSPYSLLTTIQILGLVMAVMLCLQLVLAVHVAKKWDSLPA